MIISVWQLLFIYVIHPVFKNEEEEEEEEEVHLGMFSI